MKTIRNFIKRYPVLTFFTLAFAISWSGILLIVGLGGFPTAREQFVTQLPFAILAMLGGPSLAGLLMTGLIYGKAGFRDLFTRFIR